ncbi:SDR family oxidoreductase [Escherichia coli]|nr:SDR family oxidoreductase [Escherichia coli]
MFNSDNLRLDGKCAIITGAGAGIGKEIAITFIRVNGIAPGAILTDALKSVITPEIEQKMLQHTPIRRLGQPQDIANAALFLCSPAASWVSGQILTVSGGGVQELN